MPDPASIGPSQRVIRAAPFSASVEDPFRSDLLNRASSVKRLTELLATSHGHLSIALNGDWGSGKTCLLKMTVAALRKKDVRCFEIDAWQADFAPDPVIPLLHGVAKALSADEALSSKIYATGSAWLAGAARACRERLPLELFAASETESHLSAHLTQSDPWKAFSEAQRARDELKDLLQTATSSPDRRSSIVIFVDELDRCRPDFAVELLERMKHFLSSESITFVCGVNLTALAKTVEGFYGPGYDGRKYLERFFDLIHELPASDLGGLIDSEVERLWPDEALGDAPRQALAAALKDSATIHELSPRQVKRIISHVRLSSVAVPTSFAPALAPAAQLVSLLHADPSRFQGAKRVLLTGGNPGSTGRAETFPNYGGRYAYFALAALSRKRNLTLDEAISLARHGGSSFDAELNRAKHALGTFLHCNTTFPDENPEKLQRIRSTIALIVDPARITPTDD